MNAFPLSRRSVLASGRRCWPRPRFAQSTADPLHPAGGAGSGVDTITRASRRR
jgi:hypothetical protein